MTGRPFPFEERRPERLNEYFIDGEGISRQVIQADICRYLGNDALVRPGTHNGHPGYIIRAYRNLTSEMIADLKVDSARWEAELAREIARSSRPDKGSYKHMPNMPHFPDIPPSNNRNHTPEMIADRKADSARWEAELARELARSSRPDEGSCKHVPNMPHYPDMPPQGHYPVGARPPPASSPPIPVTAPPAAPYTPASYGSMPPVHYPPPPPPPPYPTSNSPFGPSKSPYHPPSPAPPPPYTNASQPAITTASDTPPAYIYTSNPGPGYDSNMRSHAPRYTGPGSYQDELDYSPVSSATSYPTPTASIGLEPRYTPESTYQAPGPRMEPRYTPESAFSDRGPRLQPGRGSEPRRPW